MFDRIEDKWYKNLKEKYGYDFCVEAGYFEEDRPWTDDYGHTYYSTYDLPKNKTVIQFSGAFYPIHDGHSEILHQAVDAIVGRTRVTSGSVVLHVDHKRYRYSKGRFDEDRFMKAFDQFCQGFPYRGFTIDKVVFEDKLFLSCSRNFTKLYSELYENNEKVFFLAGGDRANFSLTFIDEGNCIIAGRSSNEIYNRYKEYENDRLWFLDGDHPASSTAIRNEAKNV